LTGNGSPFYRYDGWYSGSLKSSESRKQSILIAPQQSPQYRRLISVDSNWIVPINSSKLPVRGVSRVSSLIYSAAMMVNIRVIHRYREIFAGNALQNHPGMA